VNLINEWSKVTDAAKRGPMAQESIFLSTHEPCCMCIRQVLQS
jgi:tRNA(Arg) A34 adenosine deaminase TadA